MNAISTAVSNGISINPKINATSICGWVDRLFSDTYSVLNTEYEIYTQKKFMLVYQGPVLTSEASLYDYSQLIPIKFYAKASNNANKTNAFQMTASIQLEGESLQTYDWTNIRMSSGAVTAFTFYVKPFQKIALLTGKAKRIGSLEGATMTVDMLVGNSYEKTKKQFLLLSY